MVDMSKEYFVVRVFEGTRERTNKRTGHVRVIEDWKDVAKFSFDYPQRPRPGKARDEWRVIRDAAEAAAKAKAEAFMDGRDGRHKVAGPQSDLFF